MTERDPTEGGEQKLGLTCEGCGRLVMIEAHAVRWDAVGPDKALLKKAKEGDL